MWPLIAVSLGSSLLSAYTGYQADKASQAALAEKSRLLNLQADEVISRGIENNKQIFVGGERVLAQQQTSFAAAGIDISSGVSLSVMENSISTLQEELLKNRRESAYEAMAIRNESKAALNQAQDIRKAAPLNVVNSLLKGGMNTYLATQGRG